MEFAPDPARETPIFAGDFTAQEPLPPEAAERATALLATGRLHRYTADPARGEVSETARLEAEFAVLAGRRHALAVASGGYALATALRAAGAGTGTRVLTGSFTLAPVPGAILAAGATPVLVEIDENLAIDQEDLAAKAAESGATHLLLSHMRGHIPDMDAITALCEKMGLTLIEDCAHTTGALWRGRPVGSHGLFAAHSTQSYKHLNSGEGGLLVADEDDAMARAILLSGSYMFFDRHGAAPPASRIRAHVATTPNISGRMDELRAAILRPQLPRLAERVARWNRLHDIIATSLADLPAVALPSPPAGAVRVGSSLQFRLPSWPSEAVAALVERVRRRGVVLKWFGAPHPHGYTSCHDMWRHVPQTPLPQTDEILRTLLDMRISLLFTPEDARRIARILVEEIDALDGEIRRRHGHHRREKLTRD